jgi:hypothetical protein
MRKFACALMVVALSWGLAAPVGAAPAKLKPKLLALTQLPKGWIKAGASSTEVFGCSASAFPTGSTALVADGFTYGAQKSFPLLTEVLARFPDAATAYQTLTSGLAGCGHVSGTLRGKPFTGTVTKLAFARFGSQSAAFFGKFNLSGTSLVTDIVVVLKGNECMELEEGNFGSLNSSSFHGFVKAAAGKL